MVDYAFYCDTYHGTALTEPEWMIWESRATEYLARLKRCYTVSVPDDCPDAEALAVCAAAETLVSFDRLLNGDAAVSSVTVGSVSTHYAVPALDVSPSGQDAALYRCVTQYLTVYRGVG